MPTEVVFCIYIALFSLLFLSSSLRDHKDINRYFELKLFHTRKHTASNASFLVLNPFS